MKEGKKVSIYLIKKMKFILEKLRINTLISYLQKREENNFNRRRYSCFENNLDIILNSTNSLSIYLKANVNTLVERLKNSISKRPLISHLKDDEDLRDFISKHLFERSFYYEKSDVKIITDDIELNDTIKLIKELV